MVRIGILLALLLCATASPVQAALGQPDTVVVAIDDATDPVLALDPSNELPHLVYASLHTLHHTWLSAGVWQTEPIASGIVEDASISFTGMGLRFAPAGPVVVYRTSGELVCARRIGGAWQPEPIDVMPGSFSPSLAISPLTGEPVVAWARRLVPNGLAEIRLARRSGGSWTMVVVDTSSARTLRVAVALDANDQPCVAWTRPRADGDVNRQVLTIGIGSGPMGPFAVAPVDSSMAGYVSLALDPIDGRPRVAYGASPPGEPAQVRYAARDGLGGWPTTMVGLGGASTSVSLALTSGGDPFVAVTVTTAVAPQDLDTGDRSPSRSCIFVSKGTVCLFHRVGGDGTGPFEESTCNSPLVAGDDQVVGPLGLAVSPAGTLGLAWRTPGQVCAPYDLMLALDSPFAGVGPGGPTGIALAPVAPNPLRAGTAMRLSFTLDEPRPITFELHDAAGRTVASQDIGVLGPGAHAVPWAPATPRAGFYWVTLRADGRSLATRPAVIVR